MEVAFVGFLFLSIGRPAFLGFAFLVGVLLDSRLIGEERLAVREAVVLAAGRGTRLGERGEETPKGFLRLGEQPIVEESIFRGALYRHFRGRAGVFVCALGTAFLFAFLHSYGPLATGPLIALGFTFAMIREWRGSIIAKTFPHASGGV